MQEPSRQPPSSSALAWAGALTAVAALFAGCAAPPPPQAAAPTQAPPVAVAPPPPQSRLPVPSKVSSATTALDYRRDAAAHLYSNFGPRIYSGKMPPLLYAVGVLQVEIDGRGNVTGISWMRKPSHAPEVVAEIESAVRNSSPFPAPLRMGRVTYTDTWLWHKSGRFQLDTLTEGQM